MKTITLRLAVFTIFASITCLSVYGADISVTILYTNSTNGIIEVCSCPSGGDGGLSRRMTLLKQERAQEKNIILIDAGDMFSTASDTGRGALILKTYGLMKYDFINLGDQEFVNGVDFIKRYIDQAALPVYSASINYLDEEKRTCPLTPPYLIKKMDGYGIGIMGMVSGEAFKSNKAIRAGNLLCQDVEGAMGNILSYFKSENVTIVLLVSHCGYEQDKELAKKFGEIDVIIGGHSKTLLSKPEKINNTLIVQAGANGSNLGKLKATFDGRGNIKLYQGALFPLNREVKSDPEVDEMLRQYHKIKTAERFW